MQNNRDARAFSGALVKESAPVLAPWVEVDAISPCELAPCGAVMEMGAVPVYEIRPLPFAGLWRGLPVGVPALVWIAIPAPESLALYPEMQTVLGVSREAVKAETAPALCRARSSGISMRFD